MELEALLIHQPNLHLHPRDTLPVNAVLSAIGVFSLATGFPFLALGAPVPPGPDLKGAVA